MDDRTEIIRQALKEHGAELHAVTPLHGGACQENFRVDVTYEGKPHRWVLRSDSPRSLPGSLRRHQEFPVIEVTHSAGVLTPKARWLHRELLRPGADAYFLDWVEGESIGRRVVREKELENARAKLPQALAESLAKLHRITPSAASALPLPPVPQKPAEHALTQLKQMVDVLKVPLAAVEFCLQYLQEHLPSDQTVVLTHGDFRTGNFMVSPQGLTAIIDWEFAHWGSPYEDLAWISVRDWRFNRLDKPVGGFAQREPFYVAYQAAGGKPVDLQHLLWWEIAGNLRWAVGSHFQAERYLSGDVRDLELIAIAKRATEMEYEALRLIQREKL